MEWLIIGGIALFLLARKKSQQSPGPYVPVFNTEIPFVNTAQPQPAPGLLTFTSAPSHIPAVTGPAAGDWVNGIPPGPRIISGDAWGTPGGLRPSTFDSNFATGSPDTYTNLTVNLVPSNCSTGEFDLKPVCS